MEQKKIPVEILNICKENLGDSSEKAITAKERIIEYPEILKEVICYIENMEEDDQKEKE